MTHTYYYTSLYRWPLLPATDHSWQESSAVYHRSDRNIEPFSFSETLRKYPPLVTLNRVVTKPYVLPGTMIKLKTGTKIVIPVHAIHYDPKYYADPEAFEPDRFSDENVHNLHPNTYMPFGDGPRFCIGTLLSRFSDEKKPTPNLHARRVNNNALWYLFNFFFVFSRSQARDSPSSR